MSLSLLATTTLPSSSLVNPLRSNTKNRSPVRFGKGVAYTSCEQKQSKEEDNHTIDRRNVLLGLGGLYGASATIGSQGKIAMGAPVAPPDLSKCHLATDDAANGEQVYCCPPYSSADIKPFVPSTDGILRIRKPAHRLNHKEIEDFKRGIQLMKELPASDPWNFYQQATIHCTYCNGSFDQVGFPDVLLQIHGSWLFTPWHRYYIYFWEKILGKLLNDPTFAIPYWSWDQPEGMFMPEMYLDQNSPLYNDNRNHNHYTALMDYAYTFGDKNPTPAQYEEVKIRNLKKIENMFIETIGAPSLFLGGPLNAGQVPQDIAGALENLHGLGHEWTGPEAKPNHDMGNFYTAARDCMFYGHHAQVDRLWDIYGSLRGNKVEFNNPNWLDASFIFYDENRQVVNCKVRDCLVSEKLGYTYAMEPQAWKNIKRSYKKLQKGKKRSAGESLSLTPVSEFGSAPRALNSTIRVLVQRPKASRSTDEKEEALEVVVVEGIKYAHGQSTKFDVHIAKPIEGLVGPDLGELAGSFVRVTHTHHKKGKEDATSKIELGITKLLNDIEAEASESLVVSLVPQHGDVTIGGVRIDLFESDI
ncbi:Polyphenol oxidase protein [Thalictrum thalictroides]|uniref:Polyphenol oxidase protein n=1 Tax=Thalictrum thalictroides TaxID=46969 RepID=A0A7J6V6N7_THATH|nr:Polyphenol oxidase protein [Thalictrum thalictroides]